MDWFLYYRDLRHERVNDLIIFCTEAFFNENLKFFIFSLSNKKNETKSHLMNEFLSEKNMPTMLWACKNGEEVGGENEIRENVILKRYLENLLYPMNFFRAPVSLKKEKLFYLSNAPLQKRKN